jgi:hypothetical protein
MTQKDFNIENFQQRVLEDVRTIVENERLQRTAYCFPAKPSESMSSSSATLIWVTMILILFGSLVLFPKFIELISKIIFTIFILVIAILITSIAIYSFTKK